MLQEYLYEIIALIFVITLFIIYILTLKFKKDERDVLKGMPQKEKKVVQTIDVPTVAKKAPQAPPAVEENFIHDKFSEDSFESEETSFTPKKQYRQKVAVPAHKKTVKDDFKEFAGVKILVAEDNIINQKVIKGLLGDSGIQITMADDGQFALDILQENSDFNFILMDAHMPRVDGFQATRTIRANPNYEHIVVIALSGDIAADDIRKMKEAGMEEHLEKPLRMDGLYDILYAYTYALPQKEKKAETTNITIQQLNTAQGLEICGGDDSFYKDILNEFIHDYANSPQKLSAFLKDINIQAADSLLLDFIGITANIGAVNINKIALELKKAIHNSEEKNSNTLLNQYAQHLKILIDEIKEYTK